MIGLYPREISIRRGQQASKSVNYVNSASASATQSVMIGVTFTIHGSDPKYWP
ncbi:MAG: hypothetical protein IPG07_04640 [Crocinitomicaceae bacterium]|nr:hypothetical protein [Crocinitomicaceae bacterium]